MREGCGAVREKRKLRAGLMREFAGVSVTGKVFAEVGDEEKIFQGHQRDKDSLFDGKAHRAIWTICRNRDGVIGKTQYFQILEPHKGSGFDNVKVQ